MTLLDLMPKTAEIALAVPDGVTLDSAEVRVDCGGAKEITGRNNRVVVR
jgi:hypothetical protein